MTNILELGDTVELGSATVETLGDQTSGVELQNPLMKSFQGISDQD